MSGKLKTAGKLAKRVAVAGGIAVLLASCSGEPSATDISNALNGAIQAEQNQMKGMTAGFGGAGGAKAISDMYSVQVSDLEKVGCKDSGENAFVCDVGYTVTGGMFGKSGRAMATPVRMIHAKSGWMVSAL
jgi:hypothetical protein